MTGEKKEVRLEPYRQDGEFHAFLYVGAVQYDVNGCATQREVIAEGRALAAEMGLTVDVVTLDEGSDCFADTYLAPRSAA